MGVYENSLIGEIRQIIALSEALVIYCQLEVKHFTIKSFLLFFSVKKWTSGKWMFWSKDTELGWHMGFDLDIWLEGSYSTSWGHSTPGYEAAVWSHLHIHQKRREKVQGQGNELHGRELGGEILKE